MQKRIITILAILLFAMHQQSFAVKCPTSTPCNVTVTQDLSVNYDVILSWGTVAGAAGYNVYYRKVGSNTFTTFTVGPQSTSTHIPIIYFTPGAKYNFAVSTILVGGGSSPKAPSDPEALDPSTPTAVTLVIEFNIGNYTSSCGRGTSSNSPFSALAAYSGDFSSTTRPPLPLLRSSLTTDVLKSSLLEYYQVIINDMGIQYTLPLISKSGYVLTADPTTSYSACRTTWPASDCKTAATTITYNRLNQYLANYIKSFLSSPATSAYPTLPICPTSDYSVNNYTLDFIYAGGPYNGCMRMTDQKNCGPVCGSYTAKTDETENAADQTEQKIVEDQETIDELVQLFATIDKSFNLYQKQDNVTILFGGNNTSYSITVYDQTGRIIEKQNELNSNSYSFDISKYSTGMYIVALEQNGNRQTKKFMKY